MLSTYIHQISYRLACGFTKAFFNPILSSYPDFRFPEPCPRVLPPHHPVVISARMTSPSSGGGASCVPRAALAGDQHRADLLPLAQRRRPPPPGPATFQVSRPRGMECKVNSRVKEEHPVARSVFLGLERQMITLGQFLFNSIKTVASTVASTVSPTVTY